MGTNYYATVEPGLFQRLNPMKNADVERVHLLKLSHGWVPCIDIHHGKYQDWESFTHFIFKDNVHLEDEYGDSIEASELLDRLREFREEAVRDHTGEDVERIKGFDFASYEFY